MSELGPLTMRLAGRLHPLVSSGGTGGISSGSGRVVNIGVNVEEEGCYSCGHGTVAM